MKKNLFILLFFLSALGVGGSAGSASAAPAGKVFTVSIAHHVGEDNSWHRASIFFKEYLEGKSGGRIKVNVFPSDQLGAETEVIRSILTDGGVDITFTGESMQSVVPEMGILAVPYMIASSGDLRRIVNGGVGKRLEELLGKTANLAVLGFFERGPRNVTANRPIRTPDAMKGLKIRITASSISKAAMEAVGAKPVPMPISQVSDAIRRGVIEAQENPLAMIATWKFYEVQKFLCKTEHLRSWVYIVMSKPKLDSMPPDLQDLVREAGREMQRVEHEMFLKDEILLEAFLKDNGMTFVEDVDRQAFEEVARPAVERLLSPEVRSLYDMITSGNY
ncbi:MAG: TRAP transporter substrate-binding protein [Desulfovibrio sp.]|jgi:tripartite ATP-independent transporter DctP family solute receptor|nr:TRAP transporter substrate-binding protein [Desulfovibrio sp.]